MLLLIWLVTVRNVERCRVGLLPCDEPFVLQVRTRAGGAADCVMYGAGASGPFVSPFNGCDLNALPSKLGFAEQFSRGRTRMLTTNPKVQQRKTIQYEHIS